MDHHLALAAAYGTAVLLFVAARRRFAALRVAEPPPRFEKPWREFLLALVAAIAVVGIGQLYVRGWLIEPERHPAVAAANQIVIFSPILVLPILRRHGPPTLFAPLRRAATRLGAGLATALVALFVFAFVRANAPPFPALAAGTFAIERFPIAVQVLLEDLAIGLVLCRLATALRRPDAAAALVAGLFVIGHVPSMAATGASARDWALLLLDFGLAFFVLAALVRGRDVLWFFPLHFVMDVTQFLVRP